MLYSERVRRSCRFSHKNTIFSLLSLGGDDAIYLSVVLYFERGRFTITILAHQTLEGKCGKVHVQSQRNQASSSTSE
jgi:hypothetical protein